jgi:hypothetical protein
VHLPNAAVGHHAENPAHAAVPPDGPPRHHRRPEIDAGIRETQKKIRKTLPLIFLGILLIF